MMIWKPWMRWTALTGLSLLLVACGSKITRSNFDKIKNGMTEAEVLSVLGKPTQSSSTGVAGFTGGASVWKSEKGTISVQFLNGKVIATQYSDMKQ